MARTACVDIRALPLQLLLRSHPEWRAKPVVVVDKDKPQGVIQWVNRSAAACRILPGMRYAAGLSIDRDLCGGEVAEADIAAAQEEIAARLWCFSPRIEPSKDEPGVFWLDASGLGYLYPSLRVWAESIAKDLHEATQIAATVAVGYSPFGSYAAARSADDHIVFQSPAQERAHVRAVPIVRLGWPPALRDTLLKLGIDTLGRFMDLPSAGVRKRFGPEAHTIYQRAHDAWQPLQARAMYEPAVEELAIDWPEVNCDVLIAHVGALLPGVIARLTERNECLKRLQIVMTLDDGATLEEHVMPATPTRDGAEMMPLVRLRLEGVSLSAGVVELRLQGEGVGLIEGQLDLFRESACDMAAVERAFAAIRAELGNDAIVCAVIAEGHLPEARYHWAPLESIALSPPRTVALRPVVRRLYTPARELPPCSRHAPDGWLIAGVREGPIEEVLGPHVVSGGWWHNEIDRAYHYVRTRSGRWLWIYYDHKRRRWFLHGEVQ